MARVTQLLSGTTLPLIIALGFRSDEMKDDRKAGLLLLLAGLCFLAAAVLASPQRTFSYVPAGLFLLLAVLRLSRSRPRQ